ncbi:hypothetical protein GCM10009790_15110 [Georgenia ruanii]
MESPKWLAASSAGVGAGLGERRELPAAAVFRRGSVLWNQTFRYRATSCCYVTNGAPSLPFGGGVLTVGTMEWRGGNGQHRVKEHRQ